VSRKMVGSHFSLPLPPTRSADSSWNGGHNAVDSGLVERRIHSPTQASTRIDAAGAAGRAGEEAQSES
jgi:hypothetical protein